ncbi:hypothetical protein [Verrucomicrobium sp. BvORR034]|uniref:hypothetical protein n=1 Tax=Verrucomicrobium sp. BvORR034 TaxID=1396418 RepID=UPI000678E615|nr:hypothetical protein [Verrucomicrobium sp. BvORR034]
MKSEPASATVTISVNDNEREELKSIAAHAAEFLSPTQQRRVAIVSSLLSGEPRNVIASRFNVGQSNISNILAELRQLGVGKYIERWKQQRMTAFQEQPQGAPGRRGFNTLVEWLLSSNRNLPDILDITHLSISKDEIVVVLAVVSSRAETADDTNQLLHLTKKKLLKAYEARPQTKPWTSSDHCFSALFKSCNEAFRKCKEKSSVLEISKNASLPGVIPTQVNLIALCSGRTAIESLRTWCGTAVTWDMNENLIFFARPYHLLRTLENTLTELRPLWNGAAFLPWLSLLERTIQIWRSDRFHGGFWWDLDLDQMLKLARQLDFHRYYHAAYGAMFELDEKLRAKLTWRDEFDWKEVSLRPRVEVVQDPADSNRIQMALHVLPHLGIKLETAKAGRNPDEMARQLRKNLRESVRSLRLKYSNRQVGLQLGSRMLGPMLLGSRANSLDCSTPFVLIPRHQLGPPSVELNVGAADKELYRENGVFRKVIFEDGVETTYFVFSAPILPAAIFEAVERNWYGDYLLHIFLKQQEFVEELGSQLSTGFAHETLGFIKYEPCPSHWTFHDGKVTPEEFKTMEFGRRFFHDRLPILGQNGGKPHRNHNPNARSNESFGNVLLDLDADLLLLGIEKEIRSEIDLLEVKWSQLVCESIANHYNTKTPHGKKQVLLAIDKSLRKEATNRWSEIEAAVSDALKSFGEGAHRISRYTIENVQRQIQGGLDLAPYFAESEKSLHTRWKAFLSRHILGKLLSHKTHLSFDDALHSTPAESVLEPHDEEDAKDLIGALTTHPANTMAAAEFVELANLLSPAEWAEIIENLADSSFGQALQATVREALRIGKSSRLIVEKTSQIRLAFEKLKSSSP